MVETTLILDMESEAQNRKCNILEEDKNRPTMNRSKDEDLRRAPSEDPIVTSLPAFHTSI